MVAFSSPFIIICLIVHNLQKIYFVNGCKIPMDLNAVGCQTQSNHL